MADQILRSYSNTAPAFLEDGQLAYSFAANTLYIGKSVGGVNSVVQIIDSDITQDLQNVYNAANNAQNTATLASVNTVTLKVEVDAVEANVDYLFGIQTTQNNSITFASNKANSAYDLANAANILATTAAANGISANAAAQAALSVVTAANTVAYSASANTITLQPLVSGAVSDITVLYGIDATQNTRLGHVELAAANAYTQANTANAVAYSASANTIALQPSVAASFNKANTASANTIYIQGGLDRANGSIERLNNLNDWQNTQISQTSTRLDAAFAKANTVTSTGQAAFNQANSAANLANYLQGALNTANANIDVVSLTNISQNTRVTVLSDRLDAAYAAANSAQTVSQLAFNAANATNVSANISYLQGAINSANANISILFGINTTQNSSITYLTNVNTTQNNRLTSAENRSQAAFDQSNSAYSYAGSALTESEFAVGKTYYLQGVANTTNTRVTAVNNFAQGAYDKANSIISYSQAAFAQGNTALTEAFEAQATAIILNDELLHVRGIAESAYDYANTLSLNSSAFTKANSANVLAQSAFNKANSANSLAQAAFNRANGTTTVAGSTTYIQYNNGGEFAASANLRFNANNNTLYVPNINVGSGMLNVDGSIELDGDILPKVLGQNLGNILNRWYNIHLDGGIYVDGSFGQAGQILTSDGQGTTRWTDANNIVVSSGALGNVDITVYNVDPWARGRVNATSTVANTALNIAQAAYAKSNSTYQVDTVARTDIAFLTNYSQTIFARSNDATQLAQAAFDKANSANVTISSTDEIARAKANAAFDKANSVQSYAQVVYNAANNSYTRAQAAFDKANSVISIAQYASDKANAQQSSVNSAFNKANLAISSVESLTDTVNNFTGTINYIYGVDAGQNNRISQAQALAQQAIQAVIDGSIDPVARNNANTALYGMTAAFAKANTAYEWAVEAVEDSETALAAAINAVNRNGDQMTGQLRILSEISSTNTTTGDLVVMGGVGVVGTINAGSIYSTNYDGIIDCGFF